jgi:hypothetical protein
MKPQKQETCEERIEWHLKSRLDDLRAMLKPSANDLTLLDDGTLDTVIEYLEEEIRYSDTSDHRNDETGELDIDSLFDEIEYEIQAIARERFNEYGLCFDYVPPNTFNDQDQGYFRYQISWGGPAEEFRFYTGPELEPYKIEFWFLDWFDGASITLIGDDKKLLLDVWSEFKETGTVKYEFKKSSGGR